MPDSSEFTLDDAYRTQLSGLDGLLRAGRRAGGWKVGATSSATRERAGLTEPLAAYLLADNERASGAVFQHDDLVRPLIETEICLILGDDLRGPAVSTEQALAAVDRVHAAFEIVEDRSRSGVAPMIADNAQQRAYVLGDGVQCDAIDLADIAVELFVDGQSVLRGSSQDVLGNPIHAVVWLAGHLHRYGRHLTAGSRVMSGSVGRQVIARKGAAFEALFAGVGSVTTEFA